MDNGQGTPSSHEQVANQVALGMGILKFKSYEVRLFSILDVFKPE